MIRFNMHDISEHYLSMSVFLTVWRHPSGHMKQDFFGGCGIIWSRGSTAFTGGLQTTEKTWMRFKIHLQKTDAIHQKMSKCQEDKEDWPPSRGLPQSPHRPCFLWCCWGCSFCPLGQHQRRSQRPCECPSWNATWLSSCRHTTQVSLMAGGLTLFGCPDVWSLLVISHSWWGDRTEAWEKGRKMDRNSVFDRLDESGIIDRWQLPLFPLSESKLIEEQSTQPEREGWVSVLHGLHATGQHTVTHRGFKVLSHYI